MKVQLLRYNSTPIEVNLDDVTSIDSGNNTLTINFKDGTSITGYFLRFEL